MAEEQPKKAAAGGKEYILADDSVVGEVVVDDVIITKLESGSLTDEQFKRASADDDVKLVEAGKE